MGRHKKPLGKTICIIGSGVVGQATGKGFHSKGYDVVFVDINPFIISKLREDGYRAYLNTEFSKLNIDPDVNILTIPTPTVDGRINSEFLVSASIDLGKRIKHSTKYQLVVVRSTVPPGTTRDVVIKTIQEYSARPVGADFGVCMNPEYLRERSADADFKKPWVVVIGEYDKKSGDALNELYRSFNCPVYRVGLEEAEIQKYIHNIFNATKITYFNEMRQVCKSLGVDTETVFALVAKSAEGMWNQAYGTRNLGPFDGSCLPKDTRAFLTWGQQKGLELKLLKATLELNDSLTLGSTTPKEITREVPSRVSDVVLSLVNSTISLSQSLLESPLSQEPSLRVKIEAIGSLLQVALKLKESSSEVRLNGADQNAEMSLASNGSVIHNI